MSNRSPQWVALGVVSGLAVAVLAGCGGGDRPEGVDGDLLNGWGGFIDPVPFVPTAQVCHPETFTASAPLTEYRPVDCGESHLVETVFVGRFADEAAELEAPPAPDSGEQRSAYRECEEQAEEYLGADFRRGRLWLGVATPSEQGWQGGARWFRCDLMEVESVYGDPVPREGSLSGTLTGDSGLRLGCYTVAVADGAVEEMNPIGCDESHEAEFVGVWRAEDGEYPDPSDGDAEDQVYEGCRERVAGYVDVPVDGDLIYRTGAIADWMSQADWAAGDRAFRCYLWLPDRELTESLRDGGTEALPVQTE
jgi:hypothetical protein